MPGKCPACGGRLLKRTSRNGYAYYACERGKDCPWRGTGADGREIVGFMTWDVPTKDNCPECGKTLFKRFRPRPLEALLHKPECPAYLPPEQRGYKPRKSARTRRRARRGGDGGGEARGQKARREEGPRPKRRSCKKTAASGKTASAKKAASAKKTAASAKKTAASGKTASA